MLREYRIVRVRFGTRHELRIGNAAQYQLEIPLAVQHGQTLLCDGTKTLRLYDAKGHQAKRVELKAAPPEIPSGAHNVELSCNFSGTPAPRVQVQFKAQGRAEPVRLKR